MSRGELFMLSSPSGTGKDTLIRRVLNHLEDLQHAVSYTTRGRRESEKDGRDYHFVDRQTFESMIESDAFLEWAQYVDNYYGTAVVEVEPRLQAGIDVVLDIDVQGTEKILERCPEAHAVLVLPPGYEALKQRLLRRGEDNADSIARRLTVSLWEIERYGLFHYVIINDDLEHASQALAAIILEKRQRVARQVERVEQVREDFRRFATEE